MTHVDGRSTALPAFAARSVVAVAAALGGLLTLLSGRHGFHRDELYFMAAGDRPAWGYTDQPPLTPLLARISTTVFGDTPSGLRMVATIAAMLTIVVVALIARELGGGPGPQLVAAACATASALVLAFGHMVFTGTFDLLAWLVIGWLVLRLLRTGDPRWYLAIGAVAGVGLLNKRLVALLLVGLLLSVLAVGPRRVLRTWWLLAGIAVALAVASPNLIWEAAHGFPQLTVAAGLSSEDGGENRVTFVMMQALQLSPLLVPVWVAGLVRLWRDPQVRWARAFGLVYPLLAAVMLAAGGSSYYVVPLLLVLVAAGAEPVVRWARTRARVRMLVAGLTVAATISAVITLPVLPPSTAKLLAAVNEQQAEQIGWPEMVRTVADVWHQIPPDQRERAVIMGFNYGETGAIEHYGPALGLPAPYSGHMSYYDWGPPPDSADGPVLLVIVKRNQWVIENFNDCRTVAEFDNRYDLDNELWDNVVKVCAGTRKPWSQAWPSLRHFF